MSCCFLSKDNDQLFEVTRELQVGMDLQGLSRPTPLFRHAHLEQDHVQTVFEYLAIYNF